MKMPSNIFFLLFSFVISRFEYRSAVQKQLNQQQNNNNNNFISSLYEIIQLSLLLDVGFLNMSNTPLRWLDVDGAVTRELYDNGDEARASELDNGRLVVCE